MTRVGTVAAGLAMVAAAQTGIPAGLLPLAGIGAALAVLGAFLPRCAAVAVLVTIVLVTVGPGTLVTSTVAGVGAAAYLVAAHALGQPGVRPFAWPTLCTAAGFTAAAVVGAVATPGVAWVPLAAPALVVMGYAGALVSADARTAPAGTAGPVGSPPPDR